MMIKKLVISSILSLLFLITLPTFTLGQSMEITIPINPNSMTMISNPLHLKEPLSNNLIINDCEIDILLGYSPIQGWFATEADPINDLETINDASQPGRGFLVHNEGSFCSITFKGSPLEYNELLPKGWNLIAGRSKFSSSCILHDETWYDWRPVTEYKKANLPSLLKTGLEPGKAYWVYVSNDECRIEKLDDDEPEEKLREELKEGKLLSIDLYKSDTITGFQQKTGCPSTEWEPVCGQNDVTYPTECIAEYEGVMVEKEGYCESTEEFLKSFYRIPTFSGSNSYNVNAIPVLYSLFVDLQPNIGNHLRSTIWISPDHKLEVSYSGDNRFISKKLITYKNKNLDQLKTLLIYYDFGDAGYPASMYGDWTDTVIQNLNDYYRLKSSKYAFSPQEFLFDVSYLESKYDWTTFQDRFSVLNTMNRDLIEEILAQTNKDASVYDVLIIVPIKLNCGGGYRSNYDETVFIYATICPVEPYNTNNKKLAFSGFLQFYQGWTTISHEILHSLGLSADHMSMGPGISELSRLEADCEELIDENVFVIEPDDDFKIRVGNEPEGIFKSSGNNGDCINVQHTLEGKDTDQDGVYEVIVGLQLIGDELLEELGWKDVDGDGIAELNDPTPYGGLEKIEPSTEELSLLNNKKSEMLGEIIANRSVIRKNDCEFIEVDVKDSSGSIYDIFIPKKCAKFNFFVNDLYLNEPYYLFNIIDDPDYGEIALVTLPRVVTISYVTI